MPATTPHDYRQHLAVETPEHVLLDLEIAGVGSRALAAILDALIVAAGLLALAIALALAARGLGGLGIRIGALGDVVMMVALFLAVYGYYTLFEGLRAGQTPGKRIVGIRVVRETGHAVTFGAAAARNLLRVADFLPVLYGIGLVMVAFHPRARRLGDLVAGTIVVRDRPAEVGAPASPPRAGERDEETRLAAPELADEEFRLLAQFAERAPGLDAPVRTRLAAALAARFAERYPVRPADDEAFLAELHGAELMRRRGALAARGPAGGFGERFAARKQERWTEFQTLAERAARGGLDSFAADELPDFAARYREVAADLARARTYRAEPGTIARLERLVAAGHNVLYRDERSTLRRIWEVLSRECPAAVVAARGYVLVAFLAFTVPAVAGYRLLRERPPLAAELLPDVMLRRAEAGTDRTAQGRKYVTADAAERPMLASFIITNNVRVAFMCFAGGIFLGVGSLVLLGFNGFAIGTSAGHFANQGLFTYLAEFVVGHGVLELFAIWVAGAAGFLLGRSVLAPGDLTRGDALVLSGRAAIRMIGAAVVLLVVAGLIEGFLSASEQGAGVRLAVSASSVVFLAAYLLRGATASVAAATAATSVSPSSPAGSRASGSPALRSPAGS